MVLLLWIFCENGEIFCFFVLRGGCGNYMLGLWMLFEFNWLEEIISQVEEFIKFDGVEDENEMYDYFCLCSGLIDEFFLNLWLVVYRVDSCDNYVYCLIYMDVEKEGLLYF